MRNQLGVLRRLGCLHIVWLRRSYLGAHHIFSQSALRNRSFSSHTDAFSHWDKIIRILTLHKSSITQNQFDTAFADVSTDWNSKPLFHRVLKHVKDPETACNFLFWVADKKEFRPTTTEYNAVLEILGASNMFTSMQAVIKHMDAHKCRTLPSTFTILIKYYGKAGLLDDAMNTFTQMRRCGVKPNVQTYNTLISALLQEETTELVTGVYQQMISDGIQPNEYTVNFMVDGLCRHGKFDEAKKLALESPVSNNYVFNVLLKGFCRVGKLEEGHEIIKEMVSHRLQPDEYTYNTLVVGACKAGKLDFALKMRKEMIDRSIKPTLLTYGTLIMFLCRVKRDDDAFKLLGDMKSEGIVLTDADRSSLKMAFGKTKRKKSAANAIRDIGKTVENFSQ